jgi:hypothetical protein
MSANPPYGYTYTSAAPPLFASPFTVAATGASAASASRCKRGLRRQPLQSNATVNWSQFEPLVGIPAVDPNDVTPYANTGCSAWSASWARPRWPHQLRRHVIAPSAGAGRSQPRQSRSVPEPGAACGPFNEQAARTSSAPPSAASSCSAPSPTPATTRSKPRSTTARTASICWPATPGRSPSINPRAFPSPSTRSTPSLSRGSRLSICAKTSSPAFTTSCPRQRHSGPLRIGAMGWAWPASRASQPAAGHAAQQQRHLAARHHSQRHQQQRRRYPGVERPTAQSQHQPARRRRRSSTPPSSLCPRWEPWATRAAASSPARPGESRRHALADDSYQRGQSPSNSAPKPSTSSTTPSFSARPLSKATSPAAALAGRQRHAPAADASGWREEKISAETIPAKQGKS